MVHGENRIPYWIDRRLTGLAGPDYDATISFGLPFELGDCPYGESRLRCLKDWCHCFSRVVQTVFVLTILIDKEKMLSATAVLVIQLETGKSATGRVVLFPCWLS